MKYQYKDQNDPTIQITTDSKTGRSQYIYSGFLTFVNNADGTTFKETIFPLIDSKDVIYALLYELENTHHYKNPQPDVILQKIELGDFSAVFNIP